MVPVLMALMAVFIASSDGRFDFDLIDFGIQPPSLSDCPKECLDEIDRAIVWFKNLGNSALKQINLPDVLTGCDCQLLGAYDFDVKFHCSEKKDDVDFHFTWTFPLYNVTCECDLSNDPSKLATVLSKQDRPSGKCGKKPFYVNKVKYDTVQCAGNGNNGKSSVTFNVNLRNVSLHGSDRVDEEISEIYPYHVTGSVDDAEILYAGDESFQSSFSCIQKSLPSFAMRIVDGFAGWIFPCTVGTINGFVSNELLDLVKCDD